MSHRRAVLDRQPDGLCDQGFRLLAVLSWSDARLSVRSVQVAAGFPSPATATRDGVGVRRPPLFLITSFKSDRTYAPVLHSRAEDNNRRLYELFLSSLRRRRMSCPNPRPTWSGSRRTSSTGASIWVAKRLTLRRGVAI